MEARHLLAGLFLLPFFQCIASAECPDEATAQRGYKFEDSTGAVGEQQTNGSDQLAVIRSAGRETRVRFTNGGQVILESSVVSDKLTLQQTYAYEKTPPLLESVGQSAEYGSSMRASGYTNTTWFYTRRKVVGEERVSIGECSYETLIFTSETDSKYGDIVRKITSKAHWSPVLAKYVKVETTVVTPPSDKPVVTNFSLVRIGF
jgi:hypothetical protein